MAVGDGSVPSATPPPLLARSRLAHAVVAAAADVVACVWLASAWVLFGGVSAMGIGDAVFGEDVANAAAAIGVVAMLPTLLICPAAMLLVNRLLVGLRSNADGEKAPACPRSSVEVTREDLGDDPVAAAALFGAIAFFLVHLLGFLVAGKTPPHVVKGSSREIIGCAMFDFGYFGMGALCCLILIPKLALKIWKMRRSGWQWGTPFETVPKTGESDVMMDKELKY